MGDELRFDGRVVIVTGAGNGLGRAHALLFGSRGAKVVVNDLGGGMHGGGKSSAAADKVVEEIKARGGEAVANYDSVEDGKKIVECALDTFGRVDVVINNAGILRDTSFHKMTEEDWDLIYRVHVLGAFRVTHAAWPHMRDANYGRIVFTASAAGIYGNFGQANYSMAKLGLLGFSNTLAIEGKKRNVNVNTIAPIAGSRLTETVMPKELTDALKPELVSPLVGWLCHESCTETGGLFEVGGGLVTKLRWERTEGKSFKLSRPLTPELVRKSWAEIVDFGKTTHPADITASMQPVLDNLSTAKSKGGANEFIDVDEALDYELGPFESSYDERDLALYALGVGAAQNPLDPKELRYVYEMHGEGFCALPTFGVVPALNTVIEMAKQGKQAPGLNYGFDRVLHGEQYTELLRPLPPRAKLTHKAKIKDIFDKGKHAIVVTAIDTYDESGEKLIYNEVVTFVRGAGGFGGDRGPSAEANVPPSRKADAVVEEKIPANQALLYRLSGDINPLHADPSFAKAFGFDKPILHGLCTFGFAARHVIAKFAPQGDARYFKSIKVRFADSVFPGETLRTEMWKEKDGRIVFVCKVKERDKVVISNAAIELHRELPKPAAKTAETKAAASTHDGPPTSAEVFLAIRDHIERHPDLVSKVGTVFVFKLKNPESAYTIDVKNGKGAVREGADANADVTLELDDADFLAMTSGQADPQKLYFGGKLKISGNLMASQKLVFLQKMDPERAKEVVRKARAQGMGGAQEAAKEGPKSQLIFRAIGDHIAAHPDLVAKVGTIFAFKLSNPDSAWTVDAKNAPGSVGPGIVEGADVTFELAEDDFVDLTLGKADPQKLYFGGKLKIRGNLMAAQKLQSVVDPKAAAEVLAKIQSGLTKAPAKAQSAAMPVAKPGEAHAAKIFEALKARMAQLPEVDKKSGATIQFKITSPEGAWVVDLKTGSVRPGTASDAACTLTIDDADLLSLARGEKTAQALYQRGKLRVDGDVFVAHRLDFMKHVL